MINDIIRQITKKLIEQVFILAHNKHVDKLSSSVTCEVSLSCRVRFKSYGNFHKPGSVFSQTGDTQNQLAKT